MMLIDPVAVLLLSLQLLVPVAHQALYPSLLVCAVAYGGCVVIHRTGQRS